MAEPLTIYECSACGSVMAHQPSAFDSFRHFIPDRGAQCCYVKPLPLRVFREEDVRPLWEAADERTESVYRVGALELVVSSFPVPEGWRR